MISNGEKGDLPTKGTINQKEANENMDYLKGAHFTYGKSGAQFGFRASTAIGKHAKTARSAEFVPWATRRTHWSNGTDQQNPSSDYFLRFAKNEGPNPNSINANMK